MSVFENEGMSIDDDEEEEPNPIDDPELFDEYDRAYHGFESGVNHPLHGER